MPDLTRVSDSAFRIPQRGRPADVLRYIGRCEDPSKPLLVDLIAPPARARRDLGEVTAAAQAATARLQDAEGDVETLTAIVDALRARIAFQESRTAA